MKKFLLFFAVPIITVALGFQDIKLGSLFLIASVTMILLANFDKLKNLRLWGLEAELKDTIKEASFTIDQLKLLAITIAKPTIDLIAAHGMPSLPVGHKINSVWKINELLKSLGIPTDQIEKANELYNTMMRILHQNKIVDGLDKSLLEEIRTTIYKNNSMTFLSPEEYENFLIAKGKLDPERKERIEDLRYFLEHKTVRRPELWTN